MVLTYVVVCSKMEDTNSLLEQRTLRGYERLEDNTSLIALRPASFSIAPGVKFAEEAAELTFGDVPQSDR